MAITKVTTGGITDATIATADIADDAVTNAKIAAGAVGGTQLGSNAVSAAKIGSSEVTAAAIAAGAVGTAKIADNAVTAGKLASGVQTTINNNADNRVITGSGTANTLEGEANLTFSGGATGDATLTVHAEQNADTSEAFLKLETSNDFAESVVTAHDSSGVGGSLKYNHGDNAWRFSTNGDVERMRIDSSGRVIIGSASTIGNTYSNNFTISEANGNAGMQIEGVNGNTGYASIYFGDAGHRQRHYIESQLGTNGHLSIGTIGTGPIMFGNSSGTKIRVTTDGLCFNSDTAAANALRDYEKGTFTPRFHGQGNNNTITTSTNIGEYIKIGRLVHVKIYVVFSDRNGANSGLAMDGLPFSNAGNYTGTPIGRWTNVQNHSVIGAFVGHMGDGSGEITFNSLSSTGVSNSDVNQTTDSTTVMLNFAYPAWGQ